MVKHIITIPDKDLELFLEIAKKYNWQVSDTNNSTFQLCDDQISILDESSKISFKDCLTVNQVLDSLT